MCAVERAMIVMGCRARATPAAAGCCWGCGGGRRGWELGLRRLIEVGGGGCGGGVTEMVSAEEGDDDEANGGDHSRRGGLGMREARWGFGVWFLRLRRRVVDGMRPNEDVRVRSDLKNPISDALFVIFAVLLTFIVKRKSDGVLSEWENPESIYYFLPSR